MFPKMSKVIKMTKKDKKLKKVNGKYKRRIKIKSTFKGFAYVSLTIATYREVNHNYMKVKVMIHFLLFTKEFHHI